MSFLQARSFLYKMFRNCFSNVVRNIIPFVAWKAIAGGTGRTFMRFREFSNIDIKIWHVLEFLQRNFLHVCQKVSLSIEKAILFCLSLPVLIYILQRLPLNRAYQRLPHSSLLLWFARNTLPVNATWQLFLGNCYLATVTWQHLLESCLSRSWYPENTVYNRASIDDLWLNPSIIS